MRITAYFCAFVLMLAAWPAFSVECPSGPPGSCKDMEKYKACTFKVTAEFAENCRRQGYDAPLSWRTCGKDDGSQALGCVNTAGTGSANMTALTKPGSVPQGNAPGGGGGGGGGGGDGPGDGDGDGDGGNPTCTKDRVTPDGCIIRGVAENVRTGTNSYKCGATVDLLADSLIFTRGAKNANLVTANDPTLYTYAIIGQNLSFRAKSALPAFYCMKGAKLDADGNPIVDPVTGEPQLEAKKLPIHYFNQYAEFLDNATAAFVTAMEGGDSVLIMTRQGTTFTFKPPTPNPDDPEFAGIADVDPNCYTWARLFTPLPLGFGDVLTTHSGGGASGNCKIEIDFPGFYDPDNCQPYHQYMNTQYMQVYAKPGQSLSIGSINGNGTALLKYVLKGGSGNYEANAAGKVFYNGTIANLGGGSPVTLGMASGTVEMGLLDGATFIIDENYHLYVNPPGRIRMGANGVMQLLDGGTVVQTATGVTVRIISPMASVNFGAGKLITGSSLGSIAVPEGQMIPLQPDSFIQKPFDTNLEPYCPAPQL